NFSVADLVNLIHNERLLFAQDGIIESHVVHLLAIHAKGLQHDLEKITVDILHKQLRAETHLGIRIGKQREKGINQHILHQQLGRAEVADSSIKEVLFILGKRVIIQHIDRKSTRLNSSHVSSSYAVF